MTGLPKAGREAPYLYSTIICYDRNQLLGISQKPYYTILNFKAAEKGSKAIISYIIVNSTKRS